MLVLKRVAYGLLMKRELFLCVGDDDEDTWGCLLPVLGVEGVLSEVKDGRYLNDVDDEDYENGNDDHGVGKGVYNVVWVLYTMAVVGYGRVSGDAK